VRERDLIGREGRFIAEGSVVLERLLRSPRFKAGSILVLENRLPGLDETLRLRGDVPLYVATRQVMDAIVGFPIHRGVLAVGLRGPEPRLDDLLESLPARATAVVCIGIANHDNIGAIFRNAAAFGAAAVLLDRTCCDPLYRKAIRVSVGAALTVPYARFDDAGALADRLEAIGFRQFALTPRGATDIARIEPSDRVALYLGAEGQGLPDILIDRLMATRITLAPGFDSLNVAAASAIALHRFSQLE